MQKYIVTVITITLIGSFLCSVLDLNASKSKYVSYIVSLSIVCALLSPISSMISTVINIGSYMEFENDHLIEQDTTAYEKLMLSTADLQLKRAIISIADKKFGILLDIENVTFTYDDTDMQSIEIEKISVDTKNQFVIKDLYEMKIYIEDMFMCECEVR